jgi:nitroreductase
MRLSFAYSLDPRSDKEKMMPTTTPAESIYANIVSRSSTKKFTDQIPTRERITAILRAGARAPDHGQLAPWRFLVLQGDARLILGEAMRAALLARMPEVDGEAQTREAGKALRSPVLIVVSAHLADHPKVPAVEQLVAVGAAIQNMWLAASAYGLGMAWKTGTHAYSAIVKQALAVPETAQIIGFLHLGYASATAPVRAAEIDAVTRWWPTN